MIKKVIYFLVVFVILLGTNHDYIYADKDERQNDYKELIDINVGTYNEYGYKITELFFKFKQDFTVNEKFDTKTLEDLLKLANTGYNYLPDNLTNQMYLNNLETAIRKGLKSSNQLTYMAISKAIQDYLYEIEIIKISGQINATPTSGNAPLNITLRASIEDKSGTAIPKDNYVWWIDNGGNKKIIGKGVSLNYTLSEEGKYSIFLDVISNHRNKSNYIDVLPLRSKVDIEVKEKIANVNIKVNYTDLGSSEILKFSPESGSYGLIFDATSSVPTNGSKFVQTTWDFGNGSPKRENDGGPKIEKVVYATKGNYNVKLKIKTNEPKYIERNFIISINNPIATIVSNQEEGFIGNRFTFSTKTSTVEKNATYNWEIVNIDDNKTVLEKAGTLFTYEFAKKGKYNVKLKVTSPSGETDYDNKIIYINSRAPIAEFKYTIPQLNHPNKVLFDATKSFDEDYSDDGKLEYSWEVDGQKIKLENPNFNGAVGYYTFDSVGDHSVVLEVTDPDSIKSFKKDRIKIDSILSVDFDANPLVAQRDSAIEFIVDSKEAKFYKWSFGDETNETSSSNKMKHIFDKSGIFNVKLEVSDDKLNSNTYTKNVYISDSDYPYAIIDVSYENGFALPYDKDGCDGKGAYIGDRVDAIKISGQKSINIDGSINGISYSWKVGQDHISSNSYLVKKFDEIGCFPVKLSVKSSKNDKIHTNETYIQIKNILPTISSLSINPVDMSTDQIVVNLKAIGSKDKDGVVLSYLWYYYTDSDEEPQDYRSTVKPETTFVLPKIPGKYYFTVILKDNNETKFSSDELGTKSFIDIVGDSSNTPLIELSVNDSSISVGDTVDFSTQIKNILGQDLTSKATYSWDFNGDGFYDKEIIGNGNISYKFENSGSYHVKVKAKYRGLSTVRTITIEVSNNLSPDFDYISILNKVIFLNKSLGEYDDISWDLGDGNIVDYKDNFIHMYEDGVSVHTITLKISEGDKFKETTKKIVRNTKNYLKAKQKGLNVFSKPEINESGEIILKNKGEKAFIYLAENNLDTSKYSIDYDINYDSDLNGGKDDDADNKDTSSFRTGDPIEITLNENTKKQTIRIILYDSKGTQLTKRDITIIKEYIIEEKTPKDVKFTGVSKSDEEKITSLKYYISKLPQNYKATGLKYIERLQSEWFDEAEKTKVILEFEGFIDDDNIPNSTEIINLLESILISGEEDKSQKNMAFVALKNLIGKNIVCDFDSKIFKSCKEYLVSILEEIKNSTNIEKNTAQGKTILAVIAKDSTLTTKEKNDFVEILRTLVNGDVSQDETETTVVTEEKGFFSIILGFLRGLAIAIMYIILIMSIFILGFWLYYKFINKDISKSFEEFILEKTKIKKNKSNLTNELENKTNLKIEPLIKEEPIKDPFAFESIETTDNTKSDEKVPDWLKASFEPTLPKEDNNNTENVNSQVINPDITPNNDEILLSKNIEVTDNDTITEESSHTQEISNNALNPVPVDTIEDITAIDEPVIPDWLKSSLQKDDSKDKPSSETPTIIEENKKELLEDDVIKTEDTISDDNKEINPVPVDSIEDITAIDEPVIPDWLKSSLQKDDSTLINPEKIDDTQKKDENKESKNKQKKQKTIKPNKEENNGNKTNQIGDELWHDDMTVPNWLKNDDK